MESTTNINGEVCWNDTAGRAGLQFVLVPRIALEGLQSWLAERLEECQPG